jgi:hypothetical protein
MPLVGPMGDWASGFCWGTALWDRQVADSVIHAGMWRVTPWLQGWASPQHALLNDMLGPRLLFHPLPAHSSGPGAPAPCVPPHPGVCVYGTLKRQGRLAVWVAGPMGAIPATSNTPVAVCMCSCSFSATVWSHPQPRAEDTGTRARNCWGADSIQLLFVSVLRVNVLREGIGCSLASQVFADVHTGRSWALLTAPGWPGVACLLSCMSLHVGCVLAAPLQVGVFGKLLSRCTERV